MTDYTLLIVTLNFYKELLCEEEDFLDDDVQDVLDVFTVVVVESDCNMDMQCSFPRPVKNGNITIYVPCGQCICCRINKTTEWSIRLLCELKNYGSNAMFVTLTYDDEHLPKDFSLHKEDLQKFFKRLRRDLEKENRKIRYFACGEYGDEKKSCYPTGFGRCHFHAIIFGLNPDSDYDRCLISENWTFCESFLFDKKHRGIGSVNSDSIQYVTGYIRKKLLGKSKQDYENAGIVPPFQVQSQSLGLDGFKEYYSEYNYPDYVLFNGHKISIPRYFVDKLGIDKSHLAHKMRSDEKEFLLNHGFSEEECINLSTVMINSGRDCYVNALEKSYYDVLEPYLKQNHDNKIKQLSITRKGKI